MEPFAPDADAILKRSVELRAEYDAAIEAGDQDRAAAIARERRELKTQAQVAALDVDRAWEELIAIRNARQKKTRKRNSRRRRGTLFASEFTNHVRNFPDTHPSEVEERLEAREFELIELLAAAGACDPSGNPLPNGPRDS